MLRIRPSPVKFSPPAISLEDVQCNIRRTATVRVTNSSQDALQCTFSSGKLGRYSVSPTCADLKPQETVTLRVTILIESRCRLDPRGPFHTKRSSTRGHKDVALKCEVRNSSTSVTRKFRYPSFVSFWDETSRRSNRNAAHADSTLTQGELFERFSLTLTPAANCRTSRGPNEKVPLPTPSQTNAQPTQQKVATRSTLLDYCGMARQDNASTPHGRLSLGSSSSTAKSIAALRLQPPRPDRLPSLRKGVPKSPKLSTMVRRVSPYSLIFADDIIVGANQECIEAYSYVCQAPVMEAPGKENRQNSASAEVQVTVDYYEMALQEAERLDSSFASLLKDNAGTGQSISMYDPVHDQFYFFNPLTGESTWEETNQAPCRLWQSVIQPIFDICSAEWTFYNRSMEKWVDTLPLSTEESVGLDSVEIEYEEVDYEEDVVEAGDENITEWANGIVSGDDSEGEEERSCRKYDVSARTRTSTFTDISGATCDKNKLMRLAVDQWNVNQQAGLSVPEWIEVVEPATGVCAYYSHSREELTREKPSGWVHMVAKQFQEGQTATRNRVTSDYLLSALRSVKNKE